MDNQINPQKQKQIATEVNTVIDVLKEEVTYLDSELDQKIEEVTKQQNF